MGSPTAETLISKTLPGGHSHQLGQIKQSSRAGQTQFYAR